MARLASIAKAGYYPTPPAVVEVVETLARAPQGGAILDPCSGAGRAVAALGRAWGLKTYGVEIEGERAAEAKAALDVALHGPAEFLEVEGEFGACLFNPPYDVDADGGGERLETSFLELATPWLTPGGLLIGIVPESTVRSWGFAGSLVAGYCDLQVYRFPPGEYERFHQVLFLAARREEEARYTYEATNSLVETEEFPALEPHVTAPYLIPYARPARFELSMPDVGQAIEAAQVEGVLAGETWQAFVAPQEGVGHFQPLMPLRAGHTALLMAAGFLDGVEVPGESGDLLLKGCTVKYTETSEETEGEARKTIETERLATAINALNLETGELETYDSRQKEEYQAFLDRHVEALSALMQEQYPPLYGFEHGRFGPYLGRVRSPQPLPGRQANGLLPAQAHVAAALAEGWRRYKTLIIVGEMGCGKTLTSIAAAYLRHAQAVERNEAVNKKVVVMCPGHLVRKWRREVKAALREVGGWAEIVATPSEVDQAMERPGLGFLVISKEKAKLRPGWAHRLRVRRRKITWQETRRVGYSDRYEVVTREAIVSVCECPDCGYQFEGEGGRPLSLDDLGQRKHRCPQCRAALFTDGEAEGDYRQLGQGHQTAEGRGKKLAVGYRRWPLAKYLNRRYAGKFDLILDEVHQVKGADTDQGYAAQDLLSGCCKAVVMTGTIYGGRASSIFHLLYRALPEFRLAYSYDDVERFIDHYGLRQEVRKEKRQERYHSRGGYWRESVRRKEIPGAAPGMVSHLLPYAAFLRLSDLGVELPDYAEERISVEMDEMLKEEHKQIDKLRDLALAAMHQGDVSLLSSYLQCALGWPDCPDKEEVYENEHDSVSIGPLPSPKGGWAKDKALVELVRHEQLRGRRVLVYFSQVRKRDPMPRVAKLLETFGYRVAILRQSVAPAKREGWLRKAVRDGCDVLFCNPNLVSTGLDLVDFPTIVYYGIEYSLYTLRQSSRRSWRLGQEKPVRVIFLHYTESMQEQALALIAAKLRAASLIDGEIAEGLAAMNATEDFTAQLMRSVMEGVPVDLGSLFREAVMVEEEVEEKTKPIVVPQVDFDPAEAVQLRMF